MAPERPYGAGGSGTDRTGRGGTGRGRAGRSRTPGPDRNRDRVAFVRPLPHSIASSALPPAVLRTPPSSSPRPGPTDSIASPAAPGPTRGLQVSGWVRAPRVMGMDGGCGGWMGAAGSVQQGSLCSRYVWGGRMRAAAFGEGGPPWDVPCGVRKKPGVGRGRKGGGGVLMGLRLLAFPRLLPLLSPSQRLWAPFRCGSRVRLLAAPRAVVPGGGEMLPSQPRDGGGYNPPCTPSPLPHPLCPPSTPCRPPPAPGAPRTASPLRRALLLHVGGRVLRRPPRPPPPAARHQQRRGCMRARAWRG